MRVVYRSGFTCLAVAIFAFLWSPVGSADPVQWPRFRGPQGSGVADGSALPLEIGPDSNVLWKTAIPSGHSSPIVWGDRIFLTSFDEEKLETVCVDRSTGKILWRATPPLRDGSVPKVRNVNSRCSSTAATNGQFVFVYYDAFGLLAYDFDGHEQWRKRLPKAKQPWGVGSSPVIAGDLVLLNIDQDIDSHLLALDAKTGNVIWDTPRVDARRGWSTPLVLPEQNQVVVGGTLRLVAYDLTSGQEVWTVKGLPYQVSPSPVIADDTIYFAAWDAGGVYDTFDGTLQQYDKDNSGTISRQEFNFRWDFPKYDRNKDQQVTRDEFNELDRVFRASQNNLFAIRPGGGGNITESHVKWSATSSLPHVPTVLAYQGLVYTVRDGGILSCYDGASGTQLYRVRLPATGSYYASPVAGNGYIYCASESGVVSTVVAGESHAIAAKGRFGESIMATPAIVDGTLYLRTHGHLYAFGAASE